MPAEPIDNLAGELLANRNLLSALAGPSIALTVDTEGGALPVRLTGEDLTRILVNLVKNAAEAMPEGGRIQIGLRELARRAGRRCRWLTLTVEDNGPGIPAEALEKIFDSGYTTRASGALAAAAAGRPPIAGWGCPSPAPSSRPPEAAFMPPTAPRPEPASRSSCPSAPAEALAEAAQKRRSSEIRIDGDDQKSNLPICA